MSKKNEKTEHSSSNSIKNLNRELMDVLEKIKNASENNRKLSEEDLEVLFFASLLEEDN